MKFLKFNEIDSTNNYMKENVSSFENYDIVSAKVQTAGRGRRGNSWLSPEGMALFSFLLRPERSLSMVEATKLPFIAGISTLNALKKIKDGAYSFKWTNDVFFNSKKLCGILIERVKDDFVVGIGINVANKIPEDIIRDPYVLEFLGLEQNTDFYESDLEQALITHLQKFLLELGRGFSFVARQKRFTFDGRHFKFSVL